MCWMAISGYWTAWKFTKTVILLGLAGYELIASQTLSHTETVAEDEEHGSIWDTLTQRSSARQPRPTTTFWDAIQENPEDEELQYEYQDDDVEEEIRPPTRRRQRTNILDDEDDQEDEDYEPFNTPESPNLIITLQGGIPYFPQC